MIIFEYAGKAVNDPPTFWNFQWLFSTPNCELYCTLSKI